jgi:hypothetical protein
MIGLYLSGYKNKQQLSCFLEWAVMRQSGLAWSGEKVGEIAGEVGENLNPVQF